MKKALAIFTITLSAAVCLCGCSLFNSEYVAVEDYLPQVQNDTSTKDKVTVRNITSLKQAIRTIINNGDSQGKIVFDAAYDGDPVADMSKACWQIRTQDALCAYCVEDISYELTKIVTYYEAGLSIGYTDYVESSGDIIKLPYSTGIEMILKTALSEGSTKLVVLVDHSSYSAEDVAALVSEVYRQNPALAPREPVTGVNMYSGSNRQRLYEINMRYGMTMEELTIRKAQLDALKPFSDEDHTSLDDIQRAYLAYEYVVENCMVDTENRSSTVYDALISGAAGSEGLALAYVELCRQLDLECMVVYGQHNWQDHCWNIVKANDAYYHVDVGQPGNREPQKYFMKTDEAFWERYRWDMSSYPACTGELIFETEEEINK